ENLNNSYRKTLENFLKRKWIAFLIIAACLVIIVAINALLPSELAPMEDRSVVRMSVTAPEGASYEYTDKFMMKLSNLVVDSIPEIQAAIAVTASSNSGAGAVNTGFVRVVLKDPSERKRSQQEIVDYLNKATKKMTEAKTFVVQEQTISVGGGSRSSLPVQFVLQAPDFDKLKEVLPKFMEEASKDPTFQITDANLKFNKPELIVTIDREKAKNLGVSVMDIAQTLQLALSGQRFSYFNIAGKQYQVIGQFDRANRDEPMDLESVYVRNNRGALIQLDNLVTLEEQSSPPQLFHYNRYQSATVSAGLAPGKTIGDGIVAMQRVADKVLDESVTTALSGPSRDYAESSSNTMFAFLLALGLIYLILAAQFESFKDPFIIMITVPLALAGALVSLWYFNQTMNIFSQIGIIMLIGLVTKNGILIVEFANQLREDGVEFKEAVLQASVARLRPILMTSIATALGAMPIALALGSGAKSRMPMGIVVVGGIVFSLILTLFVIPAMYSYISSKKKEHVQ
ncbi:MAG: efflux RND transporter permease subunit, partial [Cytophagales bacterium]|nr:efflux RND transporter permease subunit [Cytophaga sp.]